eukprot:5267309-Pyramimonas_sp.AAC.1
MISAALSGMSSNSRRPEPKRIFNCFSPPARRRCRVILLMIVLARVHQLQTRSRSGAMRGGVP